MRMSFLPRLFLFFALGSWLTGCGTEASPGDTSHDGSTDGGTQTDEIHTVTGTLLHRGEVLAGATVSLDEALNWTAVSDESGAFEFTGVPEGQHWLYVDFAFEDGSFLSYVNQLVVFEDTVLDALTLPTAVTLEEPSDVGDRSMRLTWESADSSEFREYKLYRHTTSGLDETTGTLAHVSTMIDDTTFLDTDLNGTTEYFYRVYVMNQYGRVGGSNLVSATTLDSCAAVGHTGQITQPLDGTTDHPADEPIIVEFSSRDIPDIFISLRGPGGFERVDETWDGATASFSADFTAGSTYEFEVGWFCFENGQDQEQDIVFDSSEFTIAE